MVLYNMNAFVAEDAFAVEDRFPRSGLRVRVLFVRIFSKESLRDCWMGPFGDCQLRSLENSIYVKCARFRFGRTTVGECAGIKDSVLSRCKTTHCVITCICWLDATNLLEDFSSFRVQVLERT